MPPQRRFLYLLDSPSRMQLYLWKLILSALSTWSSNLSAEFTETVCGMMYHSLEPRRDKGEEENSLFTTTIIFESSR